MALIRRAAIIACVLAVTATVSAQAPKAFLWKVSSGPRVLYLAGSVHALPQSAYPLNPAFDRAFEASATLVEEIDLGEADPMTLMPMLIAKGRYADGRSWEQAVPPAVAADAKSRLERAMPGMSPLLRPMKPWVVTLLLSGLQVQRAGLDVSLGLDKHFFDKARGVNKPVAALETAASQLDRFDGMTDAAQAQMLESTVTELDTSEVELRAIVTAWQRGDAATMEQQMLGGLRKFPGAYASLIVERNQNWMPRLDQCLAGTSPCFVVVGAAHLIGPDGLLELLKKKGYAVEQM